MAKDILSILNIVPVALYRLPGKAREVVSKFTERYIGGSFEVSKQGILHWRPSVVFRDRLLGCRIFVCN
jgi:hypothetical protein